MSTVRPSESEKMTKSSLPPAQYNQDFVTISPFVGGTITLPEKFFVSPADPDARKTVPSLSFLISHPNPPSRLPFLRVDSSKLVTSKPLRILFDLGLRSSANRYLPEQQSHLESRSPYSLSPGVAKSLEAGGLTTKDVDVIIFSHVHYDHHGDPEDFESSEFVIGHGAWKVLKEGLGGIASHQHFDADLLPEDRTTELPSPSEAPWAPLHPFPAALDLLKDGSLFLIDAPGHLPGHVNLLCRTGTDSWVYLAGDAAHDLRILTGEKSIGTWQNDQGNTVCIHLDKESAEKSIERIQQLRESDEKVEIIIAHDPSWAEENKKKFYPNHL